MKPTFNPNMFESIKNALESAKTKNADSNFRNIISIAKPGNYLVRLLPNTSNPAETFLHYFHHGWNSERDGKYVSITSPSTWHERCLISEAYFKILRDGTKENQEKAKACLRRKENWYVNVYVIQDPNEPKNNGTVKILRYGKQLNEIINSAISGDDSQEFGEKIFKLDETGCTFRIKAEQVTDKPGAPKYPKYTASKFLSPGPIENFDESKIPEIYNSTYDLNTLVEHKTPDEIQEFLNIHFYNNEFNTSSSTPTEVNDVDDDVPYEAPKIAVKAAVKPVQTAKPAHVAVEDTENDDKVKAILEGLDNL